MKIIPTGDHVLLKPVRETTTSSGIVIPDTIKDQKSDRGDVVAVGPGKLQDDGTRAPIEAKEGDRVLFSKYAADEIEVDGESFVILQSHDIKAIITT